MLGLQRRSGRVLNMAKNKQKAKELEVEEEVCFCGHKAKYHEKEGCYFINEYHEHCPCRKFKKVN